VQAGEVEIPAMKAEAGRETRQGEASDEERAPRVPRATSSTSPYNIPKHDFVASIAVALFYEAVGVGLVLNYQKIIIKTRLYLMTRRALRRRSQNRSYILCAVKTHASVTDQVETGF
jgi:hypothetical protein